MTSNDNKRIAKNTVFLYLRTFVSMGIALFTSRKILEVLGVDDYGILNVVGGIIAMLSFLSGSMSVATQRFLTFEIGRKNQTGFQRVFSMTVLIHLLLGAVVLILGETVGLWFVNTYLNIPAARMAAANVVYQVTVFSCILSVLQTPYNASIVSYERMHVYAYVGLGESFAKLLIVYMLVISPIDKLIAYSLLFLGVNVISCMIYRIYCIKNFDGCRVNRIWDGKLFREMAGFTGWNMFGTVAWSLKYNGASILLNIFGGPAVNAAQGVASQVSGASSTLVNGFQSAVNPQITKNYAANDSVQTCRLMCRSSKFSYYLMFIIVLPVMLECEFLLNIWLVDVPDYAVLFTRIVLAESLINTLGGPMITSLMATGDIKWYQIIVGTVLMLNIPIAWVLLNSGFHIVTPLVVSLVVMVIGNAVRLLFCRRQIGLSLRLYLRTVVLPIFMVTFFSCAITCGCYSVLNYGWTSLVVTVIVSTLSIALAVYWFGLDRHERSFLVDLIKTKILNLKNTTAAA